MKGVLASLILLNILILAFYLGKQTKPLKDMALKSAEVNSDALISYPPPIEPPILEYTDSSVIETKHFEYLNSTRIFNTLKGKDKTYYRDYYYGTNTIREEGTFVNGNYSGTWKCYSREGKLISKYEYPVLD